MDDIYKQREKKRNNCFLDGDCYVNEYKGGIKEYICNKDHKPCLFQCCDLWEIIPCKDCKYSESCPECHNKLYSCTRHSILVKPDFACIEGERKEETV